MSESNKVDLFYAIAAKRQSDGTVVPVSASGLGKLPGSEGFTEVAFSADPDPAAIRTRYLAEDAVAAFTLPSSATALGSVVVLDNSTNSASLTIAVDGEVEPPIGDFGDTVPAGSSVMYIREAGEVGDSPWVGYQIVYKRISAMTSESMSFTRAIAQSNRLSSERQPLGTFSTGESSSGDIAFELLWGELDDLIASSLQGDWTRLSEAKYLAGSDDLLDAEWNDRGWLRISGVTATGSGFTKDATNFGTQALGTTGETLSSYVGEFVDVTVLSSGGVTEDTIIERRIARIGSAGSNAMAFDLGTFSTTSGVVDIIFQIPDLIENGSTYWDLALCRHYSDLGADRAFFLGQAVNSMTLTINAAQATTGSFTMIGTVEEDGTRQLGEETDHQWSSNNTMRGATDSLEGILEGEDGSMTKFCATSIAITLQNNITSTDTTCGPVTSSGQFGATATLAGIYGVKGKSMYQRYLTDTDTSLFLPMRDDQGRGLAFYLPRGKLGSAQRGTPGGNQNLPSTFELTAYRDETLGKTAVIYSAPKMLRFG